MSLKLYDKNGNGHEIVEKSDIDRVLLWEGSHDSYTHNIELNDDPLKYRKLSIVFEKNGTYCIDIHINDGVISNNYMPIWTEGYTRCFAFENFSVDGKKINFTNAYWYNSSVNAPLNIKKIYGIK